MDINNYAVIMAGGIGSRFWPFSRTKYPKQFHDVLGTGTTLIQQTVNRFKNVCPPENIIIVTNKDYVSLVKEQLPFLQDHQILAEPIGRNTAPCLAYAAYKILQRDRNANIVVAPSDHIILQEKEFESIILEALQATEQADILITLGMKPTRPDTGYGYIQYIDENKNRIKKVKTFTEKPALDLAIKFIESGEFVWNAGIFIFNAQTIVDSIKQYLPEMDEVFSEGIGKYWTDKENDFIASAYSRCGNISIDYGIMEKSDNVYVMLADFGWSDLGTWKSLFENMPKNNEGNVIDGNVLTYDTQDCIIKTPKDKLVVAEGLDGFIVAEFDGVLMICRKENEQRVKDFVSDVKATKDKKFV
ncbi:MAG: mannose-1-phosphate guanylyltransferase [Cytophaga sp.]|uniref:mannose-1-phosphate guanylyltransferase n=1 Tax=Cytophaga sp. TaxID=29535 RepID=UPI003F7F0441